jgi:hypothetical protein
MNYGALITVLLGGVLLWGACDKDRLRQTQRRPFQPCSRNKRCVKPQICLLRPQLSAGSCVHACSQDSQCGPGLACSGRFKTPVPAGQKSRRYCRRASVNVGGDCSRLTDGCKPGLQCAQDRTCVRACKIDGDCPADQRCKPVSVVRSFGRPSPPLYHACVSAAVKEGGVCSLGEHPRCGRGLRCHRNRCVKLCAADAGCGEGRVCDGRGTEAQVKPGAKPTAGFRYCRRAAAQGQRCSKHWTRDVGCLPTLQCYRGRCRQPCTSDDDCPTNAHRKLRCRRRRRRKQVIRLCL